LHHKSNEYGLGFPEELRLPLAAAYTTWFPRLRKIRTEVTHGDIGYCGPNPTTKAVYYMHIGLGSRNQAFVIEDVITEVNQISQSVRELVEAVFGYLYSRLEPVERRIGCGVYQGHFYERLVAPVQNLSFNSGHCYSKKWFDNKPGMECPIREQCGAYETATLPS
jgi:hypothetical protein